MRKILMPRLGLTMEQGTIAKWHKSEGESFQEGDMLLEVETDKVTSEVEAPFSGRLIKILVNEGESVPVSEPIAEAEEE